MVNEKATQVDDEGNSNKEGKNSADSENISDQFTELFVVKKGKGTPLKDICNVVSELEKKALSFLEALHCILYGEHEVEDFKKDVLDFSGFVSDDEECQREKVKERLERCTREMLSQLFSVFDISVETAFYAMKKKEIIDLVLDFMEAPYDAAEKSESSDREIPSRKRKLMTTEDTFTSKKVGSIYKDLPKSKDFSEMEPGTYHENVHTEETKKEDDNAASNELEEIGLSEKEENTIPENPKDSDANISMNILDNNEGSRRDPSFDFNANSYSEKLTKSLWELEKSMKKKKLAERRVAPGVDEQPKEWSDPSCKEVQRAISIILKKTDITTATFSDVLEELGLQAFHYQKNFDQQQLKVNKREYMKQSIMSITVLLDEHFEMDMSPRKDAIMVMIEEELYRLADETQEQESREENQEEKEGETQHGNEDNCTEVPCEVPVQA